MTICEEIPLCCEGGRHIRPQSGTWDWYGRRYSGIGATALNSPPPPNPPLVIITEEHRTAPPMTLAGRAEATLVTNSNIFLRYAPILPLGARKVEIHLRHGLRQAETALQSPPINE